ncbi:MAG: hypothetical protein CMC04_04135 [Flavobacteriaceae bacterium]|nr:hypothetical protein [Flavobacteriaceae bacterium]MAH82666.1 hypothetical protein [Flavobacteriaceae bacterium]MBQ22951.1 hypothetical protein [Flavobacteriales bacterium]
MNRLLISEILYWVISIISFFQVIQNWNLNKQKAYIFIFFGIISVMMAIFRRYFRKKYQNNK